MPEILLAPASFRGVPFAVKSSSETTGRRLVVHTYPLRDMPYTEDMGRGARRYRFSGFLVSNDQVIGGGDVTLQRASLKAAIEKGGKGPLVHPTLGRITVHAESINFNDGIDASNYIEIDLSFVESGAQGAPTVAVSTGNAVLDAIDGVAAAAQGAFSTVFTAVQQVVGTVQSIRTAALQYVSQVSLLGRDATSLLRMVSTLPGPFGRFFNGGNLGFAGQLQGVTQPTTVADLVVQTSAERAAIAAAGASLETACAALGVAGTPDEASAAVQALVISLQTSVADPADGLRLLGDLYGSAGAKGETGPDAMSSLVRRAAVAGLASCSAAYQPSSYDDAFRVMGQVVDVIDAEIAVAGDGGEDEVFSALRTLRNAVVIDLRARGANLSSVKTFTFTAPLPALVLAQQIYRDAGRADQLVIEADPIHPLFMPTSFPALAA